MKTRKRALCLPIAFVLFLSMSCASKGVVRKTVPSSDGSAISYEARGQGKTALVFVHCWSCNQSYWKNQVEPFSKDFRVVTLDMAGHGRSKDSKRQEWNISKMAEDVEAVIRDLNLNEVILVGSSMGGPISLQVASDMPDRIRGVACVDTLHDVEKPFPKEMLQKMVSNLKADFPKGVRDFMPFMFTDKTDPQIKEWVLSQAVTCDPKACASLMQSFGDNDLKELMKKAGVPIRCINSAPYRPEVIKTSVENNRKYADFDAVEMEGVGHFPMLERPGEFNDRLKQAVDKILAVPQKPLGTPP